MPRMEKSIYANFKEKIELFRMRLLPWPWLCAFLIRSLEEMKVSNGSSSFLFSFKQLHKMYDLDHSGLGVGARVTTRIFIV